MTDSPERTLVKICGITRPEDGLRALALGADWLGFIRWPPSSRHLPVDQAAAVLTAIRLRAPGPFQAVGVYVDAAQETILREVSLLGLDRIQLHGTESPEYVHDLQSRVDLPLLKVLKIASAASIAAAEAYPELDLLTDTQHAALPGGTGLGYDYTLLRGLVRQRRVLIAGGLTPDNVAEIIRDLRPWGVDVSSGVESSAGIKDHAALERFIRSVRAAKAF